MPRSSWKSIEPNAKRAMPAAAMTSRLRSPSALSISAITGRSGTVLWISATGAECSAFGNITPRTPGSDSSARSCWNQSVSAPLMRRCTFFDGSSQARRASRAAALSAGATASSRSTSVTSAPAAHALSNRSGRLPGTNRKERSVIGVSSQALGALRGARGAARASSHSPHSNGGTATTAKAMP